MTDNPPAFPGVQPRDPMLTFAQPGMTLRDWFAGQALAGIAGMSDSTGLASWLVPDAVQRAYEYADAMLAARNSGDQP